MLVFIQYVQCSSLHDHYTRHTVLLRNLRGAVYRYCQLYFQQKADFIGMERVIETVDVGLLGLPLVTELTATTGLL